MRGIKKITDDVGWNFYMPKIEYEDIERYRLGTFDLADFTFGTAYAIWFFSDDYQNMSISVKIFWRMENIFRLLEWYLLLIELEYQVRGKKLLEYIIKIIRKPLSSIRGFIFNIAWKLSVG